jgi:uncharacterized protein (TIGR03437 family)
MKAVKLLVLLPALVAAAVPGSFTLHFPDANVTHTPRLLAADRSGNLFIISTFSPAPNSTNIHVTKTDSAGHVIASFAFGGSSTDSPFAATTDPGGNLIIAGITQSPDFPLTSGSGRGFIIKIDPSLLRIIFSARVDASVGAMATDASGNIYLTGTTGNTFVTTPGAFQPQAPQTTMGANFGFLMSLSSAGALNYATYFAGGSFVAVPRAAEGALSPQILFPPMFFNFITTEPSAIAVDSAGAVTIAGTTNSSDIPVTSGAYATNCGCDEIHRTAFAARFGPDATRLQWSTYIPLAAMSPRHEQIPGGLIQDSITSIGLDPSGNVVFTGASLAGFPVSASVVQASYPGDDTRPGGYVARLDTTGSRILNATWLGAANSLAAINVAPPAAARLALDEASRIWISGSAQAGTLPAVSGAPVLGEAFLAGLAPDLSAMVSLTTTPAGGTGAAIQISNGDIATLGSSGAILLSSKAPGPSLLGVAGTFSFSASKNIVARSLFSLYGINIGPTAPTPAVVTDTVISKSLGGIQVLFDGIPAAILYAGPTQINVIAPNAVAARLTTTISIVTPSGIIAGPTLPVQEADPQLASDSSGSAIVINPDGTVNSPAHPAPRGVSTFSIFLTGGGAAGQRDDDIPAGPRSLRNSLPVSVLYTGGDDPPKSLQVSYVGDAPTEPAGVIQINFSAAAEPGFQVQIGSALSRLFSIYTLF